MDVEWLYCVFHECLGCCDNFGIHWSIISLRHFPPIRLNDYHSAIYCEQITQLRTTRSIRLGRLTDQLSKSWYNLLYDRPCLYTIYGHFEIVCEIRLCKKFVVSLNGCKNDNSWHAIFNLPVVQHRQNHHAAIVNEKRSFINSVVQNTTAWRLKC